MFAVNRVVMYPRYGIGKIVERTYRQFNGTKTEYFRIELYGEDSALAISVPVENAKQLGIRYPLDEKDMKTELKKLGEKVNMDKEIFQNADSVVEQKLIEGKFEGAIEGLNMLRSAKKFSSKKGVSFKAKQKSLMEETVRYLISEVTYVLGDSAVEEYDF